MKAKTATIAKGCPETKRGVRLTATEDAADGFFQIFPDGALGPLFHADTCVDVGKLDAFGAFAGFELASPLAAPGASPDAAVFSGVVRQSNGTLTVFVATIPGGTLPTTLDLPADTPAVKLEDARKRLVEQGPQVPESDPPTFEPDLLEKVGGLTGVDPAAKADVDKRLAKAAERDAKARDRIDAGKPSDLKEAEKQAGKARDDKLRAKAVLETGVVAEGKGKL